MEDKSKANQTIFGRRSNKTVTDLHQLSPGEERSARSKRSYFMELQRLKGQGVELSRDFDPEHDSEEDMLFELARHQRRKPESSTTDSPSAHPAPTPAQAGGPTPTGLGALTTNVETALVGVGILSIVTGILMRLSLKQKAEAKQDAPPPSLLMDAETGRRLGELFVQVMRSPNAKITVDEANEGSTTAVIRVNGLNSGTEPVVARESPKTTAQEPAVHLPTGEEHTPSVRVRRCAEGDCSCAHLPSNEDAPASSVGSSLPRESCSGTVPCGTDAFCATPSPPQGRRNRPHRGREVEISRMTASHFGCATGDRMLNKSREQFISKMLWAKPTRNAETDHGEKMEKEILRAVHSAAPTPEKFNILGETLLEPEDETPALVSDSFCSSLAQYADHIKKRESPEVVAKLRYFVDGMQYKPPEERGWYVRFMLSEMARVGLHAQRVTHLKEIAMMYGEW